MNWEERCADWEAWWEAMDPRERLLDCLMRTMPSEGANELLNDFEDAIVNRMHEGWTGL